MKFDFFFKINLEKNKVEGIILPLFKTPHKAAVTRPMGIAMRTDRQKHQWEQNIGNEPMCLWSAN